MLPPAVGDNWLGLTDAELPIGALYDWCVRPDCGAVVLFSGTVRDHAEGRTDVQHLEYEAYDEMVVPKLDEIVVETRVRWPDVGRIALVHITTSVTGISSPGTVYRMDDLPIPLRPAFESKYRSDYDILKAIERTIRQRQLHSA